MFVCPHPNFAGKLAQIAGKVLESAGEVPVCADKLHTVTGKLVNCFDSIYTIVQALASAPWLPSIHRLQSDPLICLHTARNQSIVLGHPSRAEFAAANRHRHASVGASAIRSRPDRLSITHR